MKTGVCLSLLQVLLVALVTHHASAQDGQKQTCGFASCHEVKKGMLNVHIVPHSHDDVGWLKTVDQYYYGENNYIQRADVSMILDSVLQQVTKDPAKRFIQVETAYLWMWWQHQNETTREQYRQLVQSGRIQITNGGWSMPDEATTNYQSLIDNFSWGLKFLNDTFGQCGVPNIGWQIDPFGHSRETASIMAAMGFQGTVVNRLDYEDYALRKATSSMDLVWHTSANRGQNAHLFTNVLYDHYSPPPNCCWDTLCDDDEISDSDADYLVEEFQKYVRNMAEDFKTNNVLITMGNDFAYMDAEKYYRNLDKLISLVNAQQSKGGTMNLIYSTPSCYLKAVNDAQPTLPTKSDDFFPYASDEHQFWTGYYTSRPTLKYFERVGNNFLQVSKQLAALTGAARADSSSLDSLRSAMGIMQHHDAVSGTEKSAVAQDYAKILHSAITSSGQLAQKALSTLLGGKTSTNSGEEKASSSVEMKSCLLLNISQCDVSENNDNFIVTVYNPLSRNISHYVRLPVQDGTYSVTDLSGVKQAVQTVPIPSPVLQLEGRQSEAKQELVFRAVDIPPLGLRNYRVSRTSTTATQHQSVSTTYITNKHLDVEIDSKTGLVANITVNGTTMPVQQNMLYYTASGSGDDGAYLFRPEGNTPSLISDKATFSVYKGELVEEIHQQFNDWTSQVVRLYREEEHVEFEWLVGPIQISYDGIEPISRYSTDLKSGGTFYTDSNGREMLTRKKNYRPTWNLTVNEPVSGNYYPVTSRIVIKDEERGLEFAVLTDRSQGGSSLEDGQVELMLHRRLLEDDNKGVGEGLDDTQPARGKHYIVVGKTSGHEGVSLAAKQRLLAQKKLLQPWLFLSSADNWPTSYTHQFSGVKKSLPDNVQLLTLEPWGEDKILLRLEHILEKNDDTKLSTSVTVDIQDIFSSGSVLSVRETTLDGNQWLTDIQKLSWRTTDGNSTAITPPTLQGTAVSLSPMQIRTFVVQLA